MVNLLVGNSNVKETNLLCQKLANEKNYRIQTTITGVDTLALYWETYPDILILDNSLQDITIENLLNSLSSNPVEKKKCNTILTVPINSNIKLNNVAKVSEIIYKPIMDNKLVNSINSMAIAFNTPELDYGEIDFLLQELNFNIFSQNYKLMRSAIEYCYYNYNELESLHQVLNYLSRERNIPVIKIRDSLNSSLRHFNNIDVVSNIINVNDILGNTLKDITLKNFLNRITLYLIREKKKGRIF